MWVSMVLCHETTFCITHGPHIYMYPISKVSFFESDEVQKESAQEGIKFLTLKPRQFPSFHFQLWPTEITIEG
jgi:hypothetical protein